jgi:hypothetical protein
VDDQELAAYRAVAPELYDAYERVWGRAVAGVSVLHEASGARLNVVVFARDDERLARFVTHGLASAPDAHGHPLGIELLLTADRDLGGVEPRAAVEYVFDVAAHLLSHGLRPAPPVLLPPSDLSPWPLSALLFDEPLREPEDIAALEADGVHVHLVAMVPIHPDEHAELEAADDPAAAIDRLGALMDRSWFDLDRPPSPGAWLRRPTEP